MDNNIPNVYTIEITYCWEAIKAGAGAGVIRTGVLILLYIYSLPCRSLVG